MPDLDADRFGLFTRDELGPADIDIVDVDLELVDQLGVAWANGAAPKAERLIPVIVADVDGTLWGDPQKDRGRQFLPEFTARMRELQRTHDLVFCVNSGMTFERFDEVFCKMSDPLWPEHLLLRESEIYHKVEAGRYVQHLPYNDISRQLRRAAMKKISGDLDRWVIEWMKDVAILKWQRQHYEVVFMAAGSEHAKKLEELVRRRLQRSTDGYNVIRNHRMVAIVNGIYSKRAILEELLKHRAWKPEQVLTIGDDVNDLTMLDGEFGTASCVANAVPQVKAAVAHANGYASPQSYGTGALDCIEWFVRRLESRNN